MKGHFVCWVYILASSIGTFVSAISWVQMSSTEEVMSRFGLILSHVSTGSIPRLITNALILLSSKTSTSACLLIAKCSSTSKRHNFMLIDTKYVGTSSKMEYGNSCLLSLLSRTASRSSICKHLISLPHSSFKISATFLYSPLDHCGALISDNLVSDLSVISSS